MNDYIEPRYQLTERALSLCVPDMQAFVLHISEGFYLAWRVAKDFANAVIEALKPIFKLIKCALGGFYDAGLLKRRRKRYFKVPFKRRKINAKRRLIVRRKMAANALVSSSS